MSKRSPFHLFMAAAVAVGLSLVMAPAPALALPDAKVDQQIRPNFGGLINPPLKPRYKPNRWKPGRYKWGRRPYRPGYNPGYNDGYYDDYPRDQSVAVVDCGTGVYIAGQPGNGSVSYNGGNANGYGYAAPQGGYAAPQDNYGAPQGGYAAPSQGGYAAPQGGYADYGPASPTPVSDALRTLADGGILYIRGAAACKETIVVEHPVIIAGEGASIFDSLDGAEIVGATITPAAGQACIRIASGVKGVELRDLTFRTQQGGRMPCIEAWDAEVALVRVNVEYWGDSSAVYASGGRMIMRDTVIDARSWDAAVLIEGAVIDIARSKIAGEAGGLDLTPGNGASSLSQVGIIARGGETPGDVGLLMRGLRSGTGTMVLRNVNICGWKTGLHLERGAQVDMSRSRICNSQRAVISNGASLTVTESAIGSREIGAYVAAGRAAFSRNRFYGGGRAAFAEPGAILEMTDNWVYWDSDCWRARFDQGLYCISSRNLPGSLREDGGWSGGRRRGWEGDGYERGFTRDGPPGVLPPELPPKPSRRGWGRKPKPAY